MQRKECLRDDVFEISGKDPLLGKIHRSEGRRCGLSKSLKVARNMETKRKKQ